MTNQERMERIELPEELEQVVLRAVGLGRKRKNQVIRRRVGFSCMGAAAAFVVLVSAGFVSPMAAQAFEGIPAVGKVFTYLYDLAGYEGRYAQVAEDARPATPVGQKESGGAFDQDGITEDVQTAAGRQGMAGLQGAAGLQDADGQQGAAGLQDAAEQQDTDGQQGAAGRQNAAAQQNAVTASDAGITITVNEYFCDRQSLYLSMTIESDEPFFEGGVEDNMQGSIQLFTRDEVISYEGMDPVSVGNSSLLADGVFLDDHTFVGIARSEWCSVREQNLVIPDELVYTASVKHLKMYTGNGTPDFRGEWELSMDILCEKDGLEILPVTAIGEDGSSICEVRLQPYEIRVATKSGNEGKTLTEEKKMLIAFDEEGNLLDPAGSILSYGEGDKEIYEYARPENLSGLELFIVDENSWMDQWKGKLYDGTTTGSEMVEFLKENCITHVFVNCSK